MRWVGVGVKEEEREGLTQRAPRTRSTQGEEEKSRTRRDAGCGTRRKIEMILKSIEDTGNGISTIDI
jgi:hypothetical protein